jgi:hypothetical protein
VSFEVRPFDKADVKRLAAEGAEYWQRPLLTDENIEAMNVAGSGWAGLWNGVLCGVAGFAEPYPGNTVRAVAWALLIHPMPRPCFVHVHRAVARALAEAPYTRIEAQVDTRFGKSLRWTRLLGFEVETPVKRAWLPDGGDVTEFVIVRGGG